MTDELPDIPDIDINAMRSQVPEHIEGAIEIGMGIFICFFGATMITFTVKVLLFFGIAAALYLMIAALKVYPDFDE